MALCLPTPGTAQYISYLPFVVSYYKKNGNHKLDHEVKKRVGLLTQGPRYDFENGEAIFERLLGLLSF